MKNLIVAFCVICSSTVYAQQPLTEFTLKVKVQDLDKIGRGLAKLPYEDVSELMQSLRQQVTEQQQRPKIEPPKQEPKKK